MDITEKIKEIRDLKHHYIDDLYNNVRKEQKTDLQYIEDTFPVPEVKDPHKVYRSGLGNDWVNAPAEHMTSDNPQAFIEVIKGGSRGSGDRLSKEANRQLGILSLANPNTYKEFQKNANARGESYIRLAHNERWVTGKKEQVGLPVHFVIPDPMTIYGSPEEDENGIPEKVIVFYERQPIDVILIYGKYLDDKLRNYLIEKSTKHARIEWFEYWDGDIKYFECDGKPILRGDIQENIYGFPPFIRKYSGFGKRSPTGELSSLIVSDIRFARDLILEECVNRSNINSIEWLFAHGGETVFAADELSNNAIEELKEKGAYQVRVVDNLGDIKNILVVKDEISPVPPQMYEHRRDIWAQIFRRNPFVTAGFPAGSSGRQDDLAYMAARKRYDTIIENTQNAFATAMEKAFEMSFTIPKLLPEALNKDDKKAKFRCEIRLKAADPTEENMKSRMGSHLLTNGEIDPITNLTEFKGKTEEEAKKIMVNILKWRVILENPEIAQLIGMRAAQKSGMLEDLQKLQAMRGGMEGQTLGQGQTATQRQRATGETKTPLGEEMSDLVETRPTRRMPTEGGM